MNAIRPPPKIQTDVLMCMYKSLLQIMKGYKMKLNKLNGQVADRPLNVEVIEPDNNAMPLPRTSRYNFNDNLLQQVRRELNNQPQITDLADIPKYSYGC